jgi:hypothetical protein
MASVTLLLPVVQSRLGRKRREGRRPPAQRLAALRRSFRREAAAGGEAKADRGEADDSELGGVTHDILPCRECYNVS